mgnify:CR=1 FL=1
MLFRSGRQRGGNHVKAHLDYIGRKGGVDIETRDGEILTTKEDVAERAAEWSDSLQWRSRPTVSSVSLIFSMPEGTDPDKVLGAVRSLAHAELSDNHDYVLALHTDTPRPHVHLTVQAEGLDRKRFNPRPVQLNRFRERFARELRARGVVAEATPRRARGPRSWVQCKRAWWAKARALVRSSCCPAATSPRSPSTDSSALDRFCASPLRKLKGAAARFAQLMASTPA